MCHFITTTISFDADVSALNDVLSGFDLKFVAIENPYVIRNLPSGLIYGTMTQGHCDCGTPLGSGREMLESEPIPAHKVKKMRRRGWSEDRIRAWIEQKQESKRRSSEVAWDYAREALETWCSVIHGCVSSRLTPSLGILKHWYSSGVHDERFSFSVVNVSVESVSPEYLADLSEDCLYIIG